MIKLAIDSAADISKKEADERGIIMIPMVITIEGQDYFDGIDLTPHQFYEKLIESDGLPKTAQINPYRFSKEFKNNLGKDDEIILITISSKLSGTYESACQAAEDFGGRVHVVDSLNASVGERLLCDYAQNLISQGLTAKEIVSKLEEKKKKIHVMALLGTLEYLKKGGRISSAVAFAGQLISLKPVVGVVEGKVKLIGKALGSRRGNNLLNTLVKNTGGIDFTMPYGTIYSGFDPDVLDKYIIDSANLWQTHVQSVPKFQIGATIGTHVGPGAIGVAFFEK